VEASGAGNITIKAVGHGDWGSRIYYTIEDATLHMADRQFFKLTVRYFSKAPAIPDDVKDNADIIEIYDNLSVRPSSNSYYKNMVAGVSNLVRVYDDFLDKNEAELQKPASTTTLKQLENATGSIGEIDLTTDIEGVDSVFLDNAKFVKTGLAGIKEIEDISLVCVPDADKIISDRIIGFCEDKKDRFAILSTQQDDASKIEAIEAPKDSKYAAIYFPWIYVYDPLTKSKKAIPPSGHIAGIYARVDVERGVHKAPDNEVVRGIMSLQVNVDKGKQDILNPKGINVIRSFPGRGNLVCGARTISKDPMWKYINVRRLFIFVEKSVERSTQWAVFEPNNERLWSIVKTSLTQFLTTVWKSGALMGTLPEEAFFVRVDRTTMTQDDIDNGRLIVVVGIAPTKPAEFVIFRFAQTQAGVKITEL
jgi:uncharacterized protein